MPIKSFLGLTSMPYIQFKKPLVKTKVVWLGTYLLTTLSSYVAYAETLNLKPRAREYYEFIELSRDGDKKAYQGFSNIINYWHEVPRDYAAGLAVGSISSPYKETDSDKPNDAFRATFRTFTLGTEYKKWFNDHPFLRGGVYLNRFQAGSATPELGYSFYVGAGWEFDVKGVGVALEVGHKAGFFGPRWKMSSNMIALGVHFYKQPENK